MRTGKKGTKLEEIPEGWEEMFFKDITVNLDNQRKPVKSDERQERQGDYPYYGAQGIIDYIDDYIFDGAYLLIAEDGENVKSRKNDIAIIASGKFWVNNHAHVILNIEKSNLKFLKYFINNMDIRPFVTGLAQPKINKGSLNKLLISLPPLPEQQKIAEILSTVDEKIDVIDQQISETQVLKKGLMQRLLSKGIGHSQYKDSPLGEIPECWEVKLFKNETEILTCGVAATPKYVDENIGVPFLSAQNVRDGKVILDKYKYISKSHHIELTKNNKPKKGDILYSRVGAKFGEAGVVEHDFEFSVYVSLTHIRVKSSSDSFYIKYLLNSSYVKNLASNSVYQGAGVPNLNVKVVREFLLAFPPLKEQQQISIILLTVDEKLDILSEKKGHYQDLKKGLMQQLLTGKIRVNGLIEKN